MDESNGGHLPQHLVCEGTEQPPYLIFLLLHQRQDLLTVKSQGNPVLPGLCPDQQDVYKRQIFIFSPKQSHSTPAAMAVQALSLIHI